MNSYFFTPQNALPNDVGFTQYGSAHLLWLVTIAAAVIAAAVVPVRYCRRTADIGAWAALVLIILEKLMFAVQGALDIGQLPLHLCEMAPVLLVLFTFRRSDWLGQVLWTLCLPGSIAALLFPDWTMYPSCSAVSLQSFMLHGLLILCPVLWLRDGLIRPDWRKLWKPWLFLAVVVPPIYLLNKLWHTNYFFVNAGSAGSPLELLIDKLGNPGFLVGYAAIALGVMVIMDLPFLRKKA